MKVRILAALLATAIAGFARPLVAAQLAPVDSQFIKTAQRDALGEYAIATLAQKKAGNHRVTALADKVASNASAADLYLNDYAKAHSVSLSDKPTLLASLQYSNLSALSGVAFDRRFAERMHMDTVIHADDYRSYLTTGRNAALLGFAKRELAASNAIASASAKLPR